ncbi:hypothetical protein PIB30_047834 [Stylosanthes scabra]|uniref:Uncharacterized protein n=1 Tax=Stylosanthes scabra TaxID=79078 RepID=A0ABU6QG86_9FABA|nr:hypothetical protein [Stylosanthes scabra]
MALLQQASSSSTSCNSLRNLLIVPNSNPKTQRLTKFQWKKMNKPISLKCSYSSYSMEHQTQQSQSHSQSHVACPKPSEIQWKKELCNSVSLIGVVAAPVEIKNLPSGKVLAWTRLAVKKNATQTSWINLTFWDELAHAAFQHVKKGHQIYVSGRLVTDTVESDEGKQQTYYKVVAQQLNFIEGNLSPGSSHDQDSDYTISGKKASYPATNTGSVVELWQAFFASPGEWWDNRRNKRNPKGPDFKHKDTGEALWVDGRYNPPWVKSQLEILDSRMGSLSGHNSRMSVDMVSADEMFSF